jgi:hypothetical protein
VGRVRAAAGLLIVPAFFLPIQVLVFNGGFGRNISFEDRLKAAFWRESGIGRAHDVVLYGRLGLLLLFGVSIVLGLAGWRPVRFVIAFEALVLIAFQTASVIWPPGLSHRPPRWVIEWMPWHFYPDRFGAGLMMVFCVAAFLFAILDKAPPRPVPATADGQYGRGAGVGPPATFRGAGWGPTAAPGTGPPPGTAPAPGRAPASVGAVTASGLADPSRTGPAAAVPAAPADSPPATPSGSPSPFPAPFPTAPGYPPPPSSDAAIDADTTVWREAAPRVWRDDDVTVLGEGDQLVWRDNDPTRVQPDPTRSDP